MHKQHTMSNLLNREPHLMKYKHPLTLDDRLDLTKPELRTPATLDEYLSFAQDADYNVYYRNGEIISFIELDNDGEPIGQVEPNHALLVARLVHQISSVLDIPQSEFEGYGSNLTIYIEGVKSVYNADVTFTKGEGLIKRLVSNLDNRVTEAIVNPHILIEISTESTYYFDFCEKWDDYQTIKSLRQVIFVEQDRINVQTYIRQDVNRWLYIEFKDIKDELPIFEKDETISLSDIYQTLNLKR